MSATEPMRRLRELLDRYEGPGVCLAAALCDDHPTGMSR